VDLAPSGTLSAPEHSDHRTLGVYEIQLDGTKSYRKTIIGSTDEYKTEAEAQRAADALRLQINEQTPRQLLRAISIETLVEHYRLHELPDIVNGTRPLGSQAGEDETRKSFSTQTSTQAICANGPSTMAVLQADRRETSPG
jgi:hypothetical protein